jgi:hypothetical protein
MKKIEKEEVGHFVIVVNYVQVHVLPPQEDLAYEEPDKKFYHLCIVNLVIG